VQSWESALGKGSHLELSNNNHMQCSLEVGHGFFINIEIIGNCAEIILKYARGDAFFRFSDMGDQW